MNQSRQSRPRRHSTRSSDNVFIKFEPGSICWLKPKDDLADDIAGIAELPADCFNHPAVLLWTEGYRLKATILIITSFNGVPLGVKHKTSKRVRLEYLPISPSPPHPDTGELLEIEGEPLRKDSYVNVEQVKVCSIKALRTHGARKLTARSYNILMERAKPPGVDENHLQRQPQRPSRYTDHIEQLRHPRVGNLPSHNYPRNSVHVENSRAALQHDSHLPCHNSSYNRNYGENTNFVDIPPPRRDRRTGPEERLLQKPLYPSYRNSVEPRRIEEGYGTFIPNNHPESPSSGRRIPYITICAVVVCLGLVGGGAYGLFELGKALVKIIKWSYNSLSGNVGGLALWHSLQRFI